MPECGNIVQTEIPWIHSLSMFPVEEFLLAHVFCMNTFTEPCPLGLLKNVYWYFAVFSILVCSHLCITYSGTQGFSADINNSYVAHVPVIPVRNWSLCITDEYICMYVCTYILLTVVHTPHSVTFKQWLLSKSLRGNSNWNGNCHSNDQIGKTRHVPRGCAIIMEKTSRNGIEQGLFLLMIQVHLVTPIAQKYQTCLYAGFVCSWTVSK